MKKYLIIAVCSVALAFLLTKGESRFEIVQKNSQEKIEIKSESATVLFVGDIMLGRNVENLMNLKGEEYPFAGSGDLLSKNDGVVANLEGPIMENSVHTVTNSLRFSFASTTAKLLALHNVVAVSLANNHAYDYGVAGFNETKKYLDENGISSAGLPYSAGADNIARRDIGGFPFVFAAFNFTHPSLDSGKALSLIKNLERKPGDFLVVMIHGGEEYATSSNAGQRKFYRAMIDAGADVVIGHHPHVVQEVEEYKGRPIFYSLGNFIFDQYFSKEVEEGLAVRLTLSSGEARYEIVPIRSNRSQPEVVKGAPEKIIAVSRNQPN